MKDYEDDNYRIRLLGGDPDDYLVDPAEAHYAWGYILERTAPDPKSKCWEWQLATNPRGYAIMRRRGRFWLAHRYSYHHLVGFLPRTAQVHHKCGNRLCVNPAHLQAVSGHDNVAEMLGRQQLLEEINSLQDHITHLQGLLDNARSTS